MSPALPPDISGAAIIEVSLPLRAAYRSGSSTLAGRRLLLVRLAGDGGLEGWGECGPVPGYSAETLEEGRTWLTASMRAAVSGMPLDETGPPSARFAIASAIADLEARREGLPLWRRIGGTARRIPIGAVIGLAPEVAALPELAVGLAAAGYRRIKLKVDAHRGPERVAAVRAVLPDHDIAIDANGTLDPADPAAVARYEPFGLSFIEQPFPADDLEAHALLTRSISTPVCLDESIDGTAAMERAVATGAASVVNIKPARVGGLAEAVAIHDMAVAAGWASWCGGMLESGIGKAAALAVASLAGMTLPADLPPSSRHFLRDLAAWEMTDGAITLPETAGIGITPDQEALDAAIVSEVGFGDDVGWRS